MYCLHSLSLITIFGVVSIIDATFQSAGAKGLLICNNEPAGGIQIKLYDVRESGTFDEKLSEVKSSDDGKFSITGFVNTNGPFKPKVNIYHDCDDGIKLCQRKFEIYIPSNATAMSERPRKLYDLGEIDLSQHWENETRDCFH